MKKVLVVALLLIATPVFAATTVSLVPEGAPFRSPIDGNYVQTIRVAYTGDVNIAAFALDISMDKNTAFWRIRDYNVGESNVMPGTVGKLGYGIFPSRFRDFIWATNGRDVNSNGGYGWTDTNYSPLTAWNEPGAQNTGIGFKSMVVELGALYTGDANRPPRSGTLFRFDINNQDHGANTVTVTVAADALRGGVVNQDGTAATALTFTGTSVAFPEIPGGGGNVTCPSLIGMDRVAAKAAIIAAGLTVGAEGNVAPTTTYTNLRTVTGQKPAAGYSAPAPYTVDFNAVSVPVKVTTATGSLYVNWVNRNRPACWSYPRNCRAGADGKKQGSLYWVGSTNLAILKAGYNKAESVFTNGTASGGVSLICASADHKKQGSLYWVGSTNLGTLKKYYNKAESAVPVCGTIPVAQAGFSADANYWYYCIPTTGGACPTGQYCAPAGICPNVP